MDIEGLYLVTHPVQQYIPIYKFDASKYEKKLDPHWICLYSTIDDIEIRAYNMLRTTEKNYLLAVKVIKRIAVEKTEVARRNRMKERVLVRA
jgi:hypothetical protein